MPTAGAAKPNLENREPTFGPTLMLFQACDLMVSSNGAKLGPYTFLHNTHALNMANAFVVSTGR